MLFPHNFDLIELESGRRRHVVLASRAMTVPLIEMHLNLAAYYEESFNVLSGLATTRGEATDAVTRIACNNVSALAVPQKPCCETRRVRPRSASG